MSKSVETISYINVGESNRYSPSGLFQGERNRQLRQGDYQGIPTHSMHTDIKELTAIGEEKGVEFLLKKAIEKVEKAKTYKNLVMGATTSRSEVYQVADKYYYAAQVLSNDDKSTLNRILLLRAELHATCFSENRFLPKAEGMATPIIVFFKAIQLKDKLTQEQILKYSETIIHAYRGPLAGKYDEFYDSLALCEADIAMGIVEFIGSHDSFNVIEMKREFISACNKRDCKVLESSNRHAAVTEIENWLARLDGPAKSTHSTLENSVKKRIRTICNENKKDNSFVDSWSLYLKNNPTRKAWIEEKLASFAQLKIEFSGPKEIEEKKPAKVTDKILKANESEHDNVNNKNKIKVFKKKIRDKLPEWTEKSMQGQQDTDGFIRSLYKRSQALNADAYFLDFKDKLLPEQVEYIDQLLQFNQAPSMGRRSS